MANQPFWNFLLAAALRGEEVSYSPSEPEAKLFLKFARDHGVLPLLQYTLQKSGSISLWDEPLRLELEHELRWQTAFELMLRSEIQLILKALNAEGVFPLLIKGTALAYAVYPHPALRNRADTDLLIRPEDRATLARVLQGLSFSRSDSIEGELISNQDLYSKRNEHGVEFAFDCHWKISNRPLVADVVTYQELYERAISISELAEEARAPALVDALLLACLHRVAHHPEDQRLIWLYDIDLLLRKMDRNQFEEFAQLASNKKVRALCLQELKAAEKHFHTPLHDDLIQRLFYEADLGTEPSSHLLEPHSRKIDVLRVDFKSLSGLQKIRFVFQHLFPSSEYISKKYSLRYKILAPLYYVYRMVIGGLKSFRKM